MKPWQQEKRNSHLIQPSYTKSVFHVKLIGSYGKGPRFKDVDLMRWRLFYFFYFLSIHPPPSQPPPFDGLELLSTISLVDSTSGIVADAVSLSILSLSLFRPFCNRRPGRKVNSSIFQPDPSVYELINFFFPFYCC